MATHSSIPAWRIPWTEEPGGPWSIGWQRVGPDGKRLSTAPSVPAASPLLGSMLFTGPYP